MPDPTRLNIQQTLAELLDIDAKIAAWKERREGLRDRLQAEAIDRWRADGAIPSWKVPRLGSATLVGADDTPVINVTDDDAYAQWALTNKPTEADIILHMPGWTAESAETAQALARVLAAAQATTIRIAGPRFADDPELKASCAALVLASTASIDTEIRPILLTALIAAGLADVDSGQLIADTGEIVPGVTVTTAKDPSLRVTLVAEAKARAKATIATVLTDVDPASDPDEGAGDAPPPEEGPERTTTITIGDPELTEADAPGE